MPRFFAPQTCVAAIFHRSHDSRLIAAAFTSPHPAACRPTLSRAGALGFSHAVLTNPNLGPRPHTRPAVAAGGGGRSLSRESRLLHGRHCGFLCPTGENGRLTAAPLACQLPIDSDAKRPRPTTLMQRPHHANDSCAQGSWEGAGLRALCEGEAMHEQDDGAGCRRENHQEAQRCRPACGRHSRARRVACSWRSRHCALAWQGARWPSSKPRSTSSSRWSTLTSCDASTPSTRPIRCTS